MASELFNQFAKDADRHWSAISDVIRDATDAHFGKLSDADSKIAEKAIKINEKLKPKFDKSLSRLIAAEGKQAGSLAIIEAAKKFELKDMKLALKWDASAIDWDKTAWRNVMIDDAANRKLPILSKEIAAAADELDKPIKDLLLKGKTARKLVLEKELTVTALNLSDMQDTIKNLDGKAKKEAKSAAKVLKSVLGEKANELHNLVSSIDLDAYLNRPKESFVSAVKRYPIIKSALPITKKVVEAAIVLAPISFNIGITLGAAYILTHPEERRKLNREVRKLGRIVGKISSKIATATADTIGGWIKALGPKKTDMTLSANVPISGTLFSKVKGDHSYTSRKLNKNAPPKYTYTYPA